MSLMVIIAMRTDQARVLVTGNRLRRSGITPSSSGVLPQSAMAEEDGGLQWVDGRLRKWSSINLGSIRTTKVRFGVSLWILDGPRKG